MLNTGLEFEVNWKDRIGDFYYGVNANLSTLKNKVLEVHSLVDRLNTDVVSGLNEVLVSSFEAGYPIWYFRGYKYAGVDQATGAPYYYNKDGKTTNEDGSLVYAVNENDKQYLGEGIPNLTYGITVNMAWKGFDMVIFGTGVAGNEIYNLMVSADRPKTNGLNTFWRNSWGNPNVDKATAKYPDAKRVATDWNYWSSSAAVFDGSWVTRFRATSPRRCSSTTSASSSPWTTTSPSRSTRAPILKRLPSTAPLPVVSTPAPILPPRSWCSV